MVVTTVLAARPATSALRHASSRPSPADLRDGRMVEHVVLLICGVVLLALAAWFVVSVLVCVVDVLTRGPLSLDRSGVFRPRLARALVATAVGAVAVTAGGAARAVEDPGSPIAVDGLTVPERPYGGVRTPPTGRATGHPGTYQVAAGDSLWSIAAEALPRPADDRVVARAWPRLYRLNRDRVGPDPDVIHPGTTLRLPAWASVPTRGATR